MKTLYLIIMLVPIMAADISDKDVKTLGNIFNSNKITRIELKRIIPGDGEILMIYGTPEMIVPNITYKTVMYTCNIGDHSVDKKITKSNLYEYFDRANGISITSGKLHDSGTAIKIIQDVLHKNIKYADPKSKKERNVKDDIWSLRLGENGFELWSSEHMPHGIILILKENGNSFTVSNVTSYNI